MSDSYLPFRTDYNRWSDSSRDESPGMSPCGTPVALRSGQVKRRGRRGAPECTEARCVRLIHERPEFPPMRSEGGCGLMSSLKDRAGLADPRMPSCPSRHTVCRQEPTQCHIATVGTGRGPDGGQA